MNRLRGPMPWTGYKLTYSTDFTGSALPSGWSAYSGAPGASDPGSQWATTHDVVSGGILSLNAWQDPAFGNEWVTGGTSQDGVSRSYGAYFVRSRRLVVARRSSNCSGPRTTCGRQRLTSMRTDGPSGRTTATNIWAPRLQW